MPLDAGTQLGRYEIRELLGAGGMGEVYRAHDARLDRDVAVKVLPAAVAESSTALERFQREARAVAALEHPNILAIHDFGVDDGRAWAAMELLRGETLRERLAQGPIAPRRAVELGRQIAEALAAAHGRGIVHRDLKPDNVFVNEAGQAKVLDFGLASDRPAAPGGDDTSSPTRTQLTDPGTVMGTVGYMSPEQVRGEPADHCSDVFSFGCVLYEMLTGRRAFERDSAADTMSAVLRDEPANLATPTGPVPPALERVVLRCLEKKPALRFQSASDLAFAIANATTTSSTPSGAEPIEDSAAGPRPRLAGRWFAGFVLAGAVLLVLVWLLTRPAAVEKPVLRLSITDTEISENSGIAISPDGRHVVFARVHGGETELFVRSLDDYEVRPLADSVGGFNPFFSPDGQWVGFFTEDSLQKVRLRGGAAEKVFALRSSNRGGAAGLARTAAWIGDHIVVSGGLPEEPGSGLFRVPAAGGAPEILTRNEHAGGTFEQHTHLEVLPDGETILFTVMTQGAYRIESLAGGRRQIVIAGGASPHYAPTGHLVYTDLDTSRILAVPFDAKRLIVTGSPVSLLENVVLARDNRLTFRFSAAGTMVYEGADTTGGEHYLAWKDRDGSETLVFDEIGNWASPRMSPDGRHLVVRKVGNVCELLVYDIDRGTTSRLAAGADTHDPIWTPDGERVTFTWPQGPGREIFWQVADGSRPPESLGVTGALIDPWSWSPDGRHLLYHLFSDETGSDIWLLSLDGERTTRPLLATRFREDQPALSPDGRWLAYTSNESGRNEVYVRSFPDLAKKTPISTGGGSGPLWSDDGRELFYASEKKMMAVDVATEGGFEVGLPRMLFEGAYKWDRPLNYDVSPDGQRFVIVKKAGGGSARGELEVVVNWFEELQRAFAPDARARF